MNKQPKKIRNAASSLLKMSLRSGFIFGRHCSWGTGAAKNSLRSGLEACALSAAILSDLVASQCRMLRVPSEQISVYAGGFAATESVSWIYESFFHRCWRRGSQLIQANSTHLNLSLALHLRLLLWGSTGKTEIRGQIYRDFRKRPFMKPTIKLLHSLVSSVEMLKRPIS